MIRKPVESDAAWIYTLIESEMPSFPATVEDVAEWIELDQVVVDDSKKAFIKWTEYPHCVHIDLSITNADSRKRGLSTILYSYVAFTSGLPMSFSVPAGSADIVSRNANLVNEVADREGKVWHMYEKKT